MSTTMNFSSHSYRSHQVAQRIVRFAILALSIGSFLLTLRASAQSTTERPDQWEFRASSGALVPTGSARSALNDAAYSSAQVSYLIRPSFAITGTAGWARSRDRLAAGRPKLDAFLYDVGAEYRMTPLFAGKAWALAPFVGMGAGAQSYNHRSLHIDATHNAAAYGAVGGETGYRRVRFRLEARDYVTGFKPVSGAGQAQTNNDLVFMAAFRVTRKPGH